MSLDARLSQVERRTRPRPRAGPPPRTKWRVLLDIRIAFVGGGACCEIIFYVARTFRRLAPTNDRDVFGGACMNNFSALADNRLTHLKVVMLAVACVTLVVGFGLVHSALAQEPTSISKIVARVSGAIIRAF